MTSRCEKPKWSRVGNDFDLKLMTSTEVNFGELLELLEKVRGAKGIGKSLSQKAVDEFKVFFNNPEHILGGKGYSLLSNWFMTSREAARTSDLGREARNFWHALFFVEPRERITDWEKGYRIIKHRWEEWWEEQSGRQGS